MAVALGVGAGVGVGEPVASVVVQPPSAITASAPAAVVIMEWREGFMGPMLVVRAGGCAVDIAVRARGAGRLSQSRAREGNDPTAPRHDRPSQRA